MSVILKARPHQVGYLGGNKNSIYKGRTKWVYKSVPRAIFLWEITAPAPLLSSLSFFFCLNNSMSPPPLLPRLPSRHHHPLTVRLRQEAGTQLLRPKCRGAAQVRGRPEGIDRRGVGDGADPHRVWVSVFFLLFSPWLHSEVLLRPLTLSPHLHTLFPRISPTLSRTL